jgi:hypothetical protein
MIRKTQDLGIFISFLGLNARFSSSCPAVVVAVSFAVVFSPLVLGATVLLCCMVRRLFPLAVKRSRSRVDLTRPYLCMMIVGVVLKEKNA